MYSIELSATNYLSIPINKLTNISSEIINADISENSAVFLVAD
jgi:hypothetical protein